MLLVDELGVKLEASANEALRSRQELERLREVQLVQEKMAVDTLNAATNDVEGIRKEAVSRLHPHTEDS